MFSCIIFDYAMKFAVCTVGSFDSVKYLTQTVLPQTIIQKILLNRSSNVKRRQKYVCDHRKVHCTSNIDKEFQTKGLMLSFYNP